MIYAILIPFSVLFILFFVVNLKLNNQDIKLIQELKDCYDYNDGLLTIHKSHEYFARLLVIEQKRAYHLSDVPEKYIYTSATVGGITTGGFHKVGGYTEANTLPMKRYQLKIKQCNEENTNTFLAPVELIHIVDKSLLNNLSPQISKYIDDSYIHVKKNAPLPKDFDLLFKHANKQDVYNALVSHDIENYPTYTKCLDIVNFLCGSPKAKLGNLIFVSVLAMLIVGAITFIISSLVTRSFNWTLIFFVTSGTGIVIFLLSYLISAN